MSEDIVGQIRDVKGRTWQEAFYIQTKAFLEKNSEHIKEVERLKAEVERLTKAGDAFENEFDYLTESMRMLDNEKALLKKLFSKWKSAKKSTR